MDKLLPCPFCGLKVKIVHRPNGMWDIGCEGGLCFAWKCLDSKCKGCTDGWVKKSDLIKAWNSRV